MHKRTYMSTHVFKFRLTTVCTAYVLVATMRTRKSEKRARQNFRLCPFIVRRLEAASRRENRTKTSIVESLLREYLSKKAA